MYKTTKVKYIIDTDTSYNVLLKKPSLYNLGAIISTPHLAMKFRPKFGTS